MKLGIIGAMEVEIATLKENMENMTEVSRSSMVFYEGKLEGASIAHTAYRNGVPFVIIRAISDKADNSAEMDYPTVEALAAQRCTRVT